MTDLPPHDPTRRCVKCQTLAVATVEYRARQPQLVWSGDTLEEIVTHGPASGECLLRTCTDCGWAWLEACADAEPAAFTVTAEQMQRYEPELRHTVMRGPDAVGP